MFDLDQQIDCWKSAFAKKAACSSDELLELESHLREEIAALVAAGRSEQEAFCESVSRLGDPTEICGEFAKNESRFLWDGVALRGNRVMVILAGLAAVLLGLAVGMKRGDGLLGVHLGSIIFAYVVPFLLAVVGTYAIFRAAIVKSGPDAVPRPIRRAVPVSVRCYRACKCHGSYPGRPLGRASLGPVLGLGPQRNRRTLGCSLRTGPLSARHQAQTKQRPSRASELDYEPGDVCRLVWASGVHGIGRPVRSRRSCRLPRRSTGDSEHLPLSVQTHLSRKLIGKRCCAPSPRRRHSTVKPCRRRSSSRMG